VTKNENPVSDDRVQTADKPFGIFGVILGLVPMICSPCQGIGFMGITSKA